MTFEQSRDSLEFKKAMQNYRFAENAHNDIECQKAMGHFNANLPIEKGWITTEDGQHLFIGADGVLHGGKSAYEAHQNEFGSDSSSSSKDTNKDNSEKPKTTKIYEGPARKFKSGTEANEYFGKAWDNSLTTNEKDAVTAYTNTNWYKTVNTRLRAGMDLLNSGDLDKVKALDAAITKSELKEAIEVRRFSDAGLFKPGGGAISFKELESLVGTTITDMGYTSTTVLPKDSSHFGNIAMRITVPPGKGRGAYVSNLAKYKGEREFLLARGTNFKVTGIKGKPGKPIVEMTIVD